MIFMLMGCSNDIKTEKNNVEYSGVLENSLDEEMRENIKSSTGDGEFKFGEVLLEVTDDEIYIGIVPIYFEKRERDSLLILSGCDKKNICKETAVILDSGEFHYLDDLFSFMWNAVTIGGEVYVYYYGFIPKEVESVSYSKKEIMFISKEVTFDGMNGIYTLWLYKMSIDEVFDESLIEIVEKK